MVPINWFCTHFFYFRNYSLFRNDLFKVRILTFLPVMFFLPSLGEFVEKRTHLSRSLNVSRVCNSGGAFDTKRYKT